MFEIIAIMALVMATASLSVQLTLLLSNRQPKIQQAPVVERDTSLDSASDAEVQAYLNNDPAIKQNQKDLEKLESAMSDDAPFNGIDEEFGL